MFDSSSYESGMPSCILSSLDLSSSPADAFLVSGSDPTGPELSDSLMIRGQLLCTTDLHHNLHQFHDEQGEE